MALPRAEMMSFGEILQAFRDRYKVDPISSRTIVNSLSQKVGESVIDFAARVRVLAKGMLPPIPDQLKAYECHEDRYIIPNPFFEEENEGYNMKLKNAENEMTNPFLRGLRPEISARLPAQKYETLEQIIEAAVSAEW